MELGEVFVRMNMQWMKSEKGRRKHKVTREWVIDVEL